MKKTSHNTVENTGSISSKTGLPPGTLVHLGSRFADQTKITVIDYDADQFKVDESSEVDTCFSFRDTDTVTWINVDGLNNVENIQKLGEHYKVHNLILEDILNTSHRPKAEEVDEKIFVTIKMLGINEDGTRIVSEQISLVLGQNWIISFQEQEGDVLDYLRGRLKQPVSLLRKKGADFLMYRIIDTIVDNYFFIIDHLTDKITKLDKLVLNNSDKSTLREIQATKRKLVNFRKWVYPMRETLNTLKNSNSALITAETKQHLTDVIDHVTHVIDFIEVQRDMMNTVMDLYLSGVNNKMNQTMQVLTVVATIFIPPTFIAGIYGMNFQYIPELEFKYGYFVVWGLIILSSFGMLYYFKKRGLIGSK